MTKNLRKVIRKIYMNAREPDISQRSFSPEVYPVNWNNAVRYVNAKDKRLSFNKIFKPLVVEIYQQDLKEYVAGGHKLTTEMKRTLKYNAKEKAKDITKTQIAIKAAEKQSHKEREDVLPEG